MQRAWFWACCLVAVVGFGGVVWGQGQAQGRGPAAAQPQEEPLTVRGRKPLVGSAYEKAPQPPPEDFRKLMMGNNAIMSVDGRGGDGAGTGNAASGGFVLPGSLSTNLAEGETQNWEAAAKDAAALKENFAQIEAFWVAKKDEDGIALSRDGLKYIEQLTQGIAKKDRVASVRAQIGIAETCRECHIGHRVIVLTLPQTFGII